MKTGQLDHVATVDQCLASSSMDLVDGTAKAWIITKISDLLDMKYETALQWVLEQSVLIQIAMRSPDTRRGLNSGQRLIAAAYVLVLFLNAEGWVATL